MNEAICDKINEQDIFLFVIIAGHFREKMIKRTAAASFLLLAGIIFLGHAVVPHHHHGNLICFVKSHCTDEYPAGDHGSSPDSHHHDGQEGPDQCLLKDPVIVSSNQTGAGLKITDLKGSQPFSESLFACLKTDDPWLQATDLLHSLSLPPVIFHYLSLSSCSPGLRAPPIV